MFILGFTQIINPFFWAKLIIVNNLEQEDNFWNEKSFNIVLKFGWLFFIIVCFGVILGIILTF